jgi:histidyl-tRNA synthetase
MKYQAPKGVKEYLPPSSALFERVREALIAPARLANYQLMELAIFEETEVFTRGVGESTDVVSKEMYTFTDRAERSLTLRPEGTAGVMRAVIESGLDRGQLPVKIWYAGPFFRAERPQAGRYRQFYQVGIEAIGSEDPLLDVEVISIAAKGFSTLGLTGFELVINSLGDSESRSAYRQALTEFLLSLSLDEATKERAKLNPLRVLDDKRPEMIAALASVPSILDFLNDSSRAEFEIVQQGLTDLGINFSINPRLVRGLDYYTKTTFEFVHPMLGAQSGIGGGGRYDGLMESLGGQPLSGIGFGIGVDRVILACEAEGIALLQESELACFIIPLGTEFESQALQLASQLRDQKIRVDIAFGGRALKGAMKAADKSGARYAFVLGERESASGEIELKELASGAVQSIRLSDLPQFFTRSLGANS